MHEQSESVESSPGTFINIYGRGTSKSGKPLEPLYPWEQPSYKTLQEAVNAAIQRSDAQTRPGFRQTSTSITDQLIHYLSQIMRGVRSDQP